MRLKNWLIPYALIIVVIPAMVAHLAGPLSLNTALWETVMDILMASTALGGLVQVWIRKKSEFKSWIPLALLTVLILLPQLYLWKSQDRGVYELRTIYRFTLIYITLFVIPLEIHLHRREVCRLISGFCIFGLLCCGYELIQHPRVWEAMSFFSGKSGRVRSFFENTNRFGAYCALWFILCLFAVQLSERKLWLVPTSFFGFFLVCTESRGAIVLALIYCMGFLISYRRRLGTKNLLMILVDLIIVLAVLWSIPPTREFLTALIGLDIGVSHRDLIWKEAWRFYLEANPLTGHGLGTPIEKIMIERLSRNVNTHNMYLYVLNSGGILMMIFYVLSFGLLLHRGRYRHHYLIPLLIAFLVYGFFEMASVPFDYWHLSNMFTVSLFFIPAALGREK